MNTENVEKFRPRIFSSELILGFIFYILCRGYLIWFNDGPFISNDYYQYESVAQNFLEGKISKTSVIHFDAERSHGISGALVLSGRRRPAGRLFAACQGRWAALNL